jgi:hypothetical protein
LTHLEKINVAAADIAILSTGLRRNEPGQSLQMGIRVGSGSSCSQMRQPAGNTTLSNAARTIAEPSARNASRGKRIAARQSPQLSWAKFNCSALKSNYYLVI